MLTISCQHPVVLFLLLQFCIFLPSDRDEVCSFVESSFQHSISICHSNQFCLVFVILLPVASIIAMLSCRVRETQFYGSLTLVCCHYSCHHIPLWVANCLNRIFSTLRLEVSSYHAIPHIQLLPGILYVVRSKAIYLQSHASQMHSVRITPIPVGSIARPTLLLKFRSIEFPVAVSEILHFVRLLYPQVLWIIKAVPSPFALCSEGYSIMVIFRKRLQSCYISRKGEVPISDTQRRQGINTCHNWVITFHQSPSVNRSQLSPLHTKC